MNPDNLDPSVLAGPVFDCPVFDCPVVVGVVIVAALRHPRSDTGGEHQGTGNSGELSEHEMTSSTTAIVFTCVVDRQHTSANRGDHTRWRSGHRRAQHGLGRRAPAWP